MTIAAFCQLLRTYCKGHVKTPTHALLPMTVYHHTRSKLLITMLNGFGHGISAIQLLELDTAMAEGVVRERGDGRVLPSNVNTTYSAVFCYDNFDLCEETHTSSIALLTALTVLSSSDCL